MRIPIYYVAYENIIKIKVDDFEKEWIFDKPDYGVRLIIPSTDNGEEEPMEIDLSIQIAEAVYLPNGYTPVSCTYSINFNRRFAKPIDMHVEHNFVNGDELVSLKRMNSDDTFLVSNDLTHLDKNYVLLKLETHSKQEVVIAAGMKKRPPLKRYATMLLFKQVPYGGPSGSFTCDVILVVTQDLQPYLEVWVHAW